MSFLAAPPQIFVVRSMYCVCVLSGTMPGLLWLFGPEALSGVQYTLLRQVSFTVGPTRTDEAVCAGLQR